MNDEILLAWLFQKTYRFNLLEFEAAIKLKINYENLDWKKIHQQNAFLDRFTDKEKNEIKFEIDKQRQLGVLFTYPTHIHYPPAFANLVKPPLLLSFKGSPVWLNHDFLSVVGSRNPSSSSIQWMEVHLSQILRTHNIGLASGGAHGIDQKAHLLCLFNKRPTIVFAPSGVSELYPKTLSFFAEQILEQGGAIISEYSPTEKMQKGFFVQRNRLISGISKAVLLVEAGRRSGTMITANYAIEQSKPLWVIPSHPFDTKSLGGLDLLQEGATMVRDAEDLNLFIGTEF